MINSCGTGKPTEADGERERGSGRKRRQLFGLFGLFGCSAVRLFGLFGRRRLSSPGRRRGERSEAPPQRSCSFVVLLCC